uniref:RING-type domain-containing protein n=2 Tax=Aegilops tauschii TaxID=37682 RepID=A0A453J1P0_AEGTS
QEGILSECAICLSEFAGKEEIRVLPQCGHGFHVACVDAWLRAHSSCPSCRRVVVVVAADAAPRKTPPEPKRCRKCEAMEEASSSTSATAGDHGAARFLP